MHTQPHPAVFTLSMNWLLDRFLCRGQEASQSVLPYIFFFQLSIIFSNLVLFFSNLVLFSLNLVLFFSKLVPYLPIIFFSAFSPVVC